MSRLVSDLAYCYCMQYTELSSQNKQLSENGKKTPKQQAE